MKSEHLPDGSSDCPLIRLFDFDAAEACRLKSLFDALTDGQVHEVVLTDLADVSGIGCCRLMLMVCPQDIGVVQVNDRTSFGWQMSPQGWKSVADLTEPFCQEVKPSHYQ